MAASAQCLASYSISTLARHSLPLVPPLFLTLYHYLTLFPLLFDSDIYFIQIPMSFRYLYYADMGWLWLVGSMKLQVSFAKEPYKRDTVLQKRPIILSILLTVATPQKGGSVCCSACCIAVCVVVCVAVLCSVCCGVLRSACCSVC